MLFERRIANAAWSYTYETDAQRPNVYYVATQLGGVILRKDVHTTTTIGGASPQVVVQDYTSVLDSPTPSPSPNAAAGQGGAAK